MDSIKSFDQIAAFLTGLDTEYERYAEAFWNNGKGFSKFSQIASSTESFLVQKLGVSEFHVGHIIKQAAAKSQRVASRRGQDAEPGQAPDVEMRDADQRNQNYASPSGSGGPIGRGQLRGDKLSSAMERWNEDEFGSGTEGLSNVPVILPRKHLVEGILELMVTGGLAFLQGPPYGGKTATLDLVLRRAAAEGIDTYYINVAGKSNVEEFMRHKLGADALDLLEEDKKVVIAIDEIQCSYNQARTNSYKLWNFLKQLQAGGKGKVRVLLAAAYGARPSGLQSDGNQGSPHSTPITIFPHLIVTTHPPSETRPISLKMLPEEYEELCTLFEAHSRLQFEPFTLNHIRDLSGLQIGGATFCLNYLKENLSSQERQADQRDVAALYKLSSYKFYHSLELLRSVLPYASLQEASKDILTTIFWADAKGVFVDRFQGHQEALAGLRRAGQIIIDEDGWVTFASPLHKIYFGVSHFSRSRQSPLAQGTLRDFVIASISMMDPYVLKYTEALSTDQSILERLWQMEGFRAGSIVVPEGSYMSPDVGWTLGINGWCDFYVGHPCCWALEFVAQGDMIDKHLARFASGGEYHAMLEDGRVHDWACVDFRSPGTVVQPSKRHPQLYTVVFQDETYETAVVFNNGHRQDIKLGGFREPSKDITTIREWAERARGA